MDDVRTSPEEIYGVKVQLADGGILPAELISYAKYASESYAGACCLKLHIANVGDFSQESHNYFDALVDLRKRLEPMQIKVLCWGARTDVWASGMQRDMGAGLVAFLLSSEGNGRPPYQSIFDYAPPETIGSADEQRKYAKRWMDMKKQQI